MAVLTSDTINQRETKIANMKGTVMCFLEFYDVKRSSNGLVQL